MWFQGFCECVRESSGCRALWTVFGRTCRRIHILVAFCDGNPTYSHHYRFSLRRTWWRLVLNLMLRIWSVNKKITFNNEQNSKQKKNVEGLLLIVAGCEKGTIWKTSHSLFNGNEWNLNNLRLLSRRWWWWLKFRISPFSNKERDTVGVRKNDINLIKIHKFKCR